MEFFKSYLRGACVTYTPLSWYFVSPLGIQQNLENVVISLHKNTKAVPVPYCSYPEDYKPLIIKPQFKTFSAIARQNNILLKLCVPLCTLLLYRESFLITKWLSLSRKNYSNVRRALHIGRCVKHILPPVFLIYNKFCIILGFVNCFIGMFIMFEFQLLKKEWSKCFYLIKAGSHNTWITWITYNLNHL